jgi:hypothetical protein
VRAQTAARLGWALFALSVLLFAPALILNLGRPQDADLAFTTGELLLRLALLLFGWFGALIVSHRPGQTIGWVLCALGLMSGFGAFAVEYAVYGLITRPGAVPAAATVAWCATWEFAVDFGLLAALLVLFPSGRPPSPRWRWVLWLAATGVVLATVGALGLWPLRGRALLQLYTPDPVGVLGVLYSLGSWATEVAILAAVASLVVRFRRASGAERQQLKWLFYWVAVLVVGFPITAAALDKVSSELAADLIFALLIVPIPLAVGVAIVKHRLYDIDRLINRTLVYGLLTALLATVYAGVVLVLAQLFGGLGAEPPSWAVAAATASSKPSIGGSTGTNTTRPRPSRGSAAGYATNSTCTLCRGSCWRWSTRPCSRPRRRCGYDPLRAATHPSLRKEPRPGPPPSSAGSLSRRLDAMKERGLRSP